MAAVVDTVTINHERATEFWMLRDPIILFPALYKSVCLSTGLWLFADTLHSLHSVKGPGRGPKMAKGAHGIGLFRTGYRGIIDKENSN